MARWDALSSDPALRYLALSLPGRPMTADLQTLLRKHPFFAGVEGPALLRLGQSLRRASLKAGETLFQRGDVGAAMFIVESGAIRLARDGAQGREFTVRLAGPGEAFGEIALLDGGGRTTDAAAITPSTVVSLARRDFQAAFRESPAMQDAVLANLCGRLRATTDQLESIALLPLEARLAQLFLLLAGSSVDDDKARAVVDLAIDQRELAALVGATRPRVNRVLVRWDQARIATRKARRYDCDLDALRDVVASGEGE